MCQYFIPLYGQIISHHVDIPQCVYPFTPTDGHMGSFHLLAFMNNAAMNTGVQVSVWTHNFTLLLGIYFGVDLLSHMVAPRLSV